MLNAGFSLALGRVAYTLGEKPSWHYIRYPFHPLLPLHDLSLWSIFLLIHFSYHPFYLSPSTLLPQLHTHAASTINKWHVHTDDHVYVQLRTHLVICLFVDLIYQLTQLCRLVSISVVHVNQSLLVHLPIECPCEYFGCVLAYLFGYTFW